MPTEGLSANLHPVALAVRELEDAQRRAANADDPNLAKQIGDTAWGLNNYLLDAARAEGPAPPGGGVLDGKLGNTPTREVLRIAALMLDEAAQRLGGLVDMPVVAKKLRELATKGADHG